MYACANVFSTHVNADNRQPKTTHHHHHTLHFTGAAEAGVRGHHGLRQGHPAGTRVRFSCRLRFACSGDGGGTTCMFVCACATPFPIPPTAHNIPHDIIHNGSRWTRRSWWCLPSASRSSARRCVHFLGLCTTRVTVRPSVPFVVVAHPNTNIHQHHNTKTQQIAFWEAEFARLHPPLCVDI